MTDTPPDVQARFDELMRQRSGSERVRMMSEMFDLAKALALSNLRSTHPGATEADLRVLLFDRLYGDELDMAERSHILTRLRAHAEPSTTSAFRRTDRRSNSRSP
ncbi:MAG: hypothetical protein A3H29_12300 [Acidobacteria bacterium RIFCSPLOWO2_02_FULL_67_21]|nr:MAG: hypothetical protein A3H29_12300 [Acidobacteria bacterium RIFCSPLOWO2_02_FULL_67_21]